MINKLKLVWYYIETRYVKLLHVFSIKQNADIIPKGSYCYSIDEERNRNEPSTDGSYYIKTCKYYRSTLETGGIACTYTGFYGFDCCLYDSCKICGENDEINEVD